MKVYYKTVVTSLNKKKNIIKLIWGIIIVNFNLIKYIFIKIKFLLIFNIKFIYLFIFSILFLDMPG